MGSEPEDVRSGQIARARTFVLRSLAARVHSVTEIEAELAVRGVPPDVADEVVLDDAELAGQLASGFRARGYGPRRASEALRRRRVSPADAAAALDDVFGGTDEVALAEAALGSRSVTDPGERRRAVALLVRRGFSSGVAWQVVDARTARR
jgi:SOS response regulatory protein OraA/RecX